MAAELRVVSTPASRRSVAAWMAAAAGFGAVSAESPMLAGATGTAGLLLVLPWIAAFACLVALSTLQRWTFELGGLTIRPDELIAAVFAIRVLTLSRRFALASTEWVIVAFVVLQVATSAINAADVTKSLLDSALLGFGVLAYLATSVAASSPERLRTAVRLFLSAVVAVAGVGLIALAAHYVVGSNWGVTLVDTLHGFPAIQGLSYEHDVYGSTCAAGAIAFLVLWRESSSLFSRRVMRVGSWVCMLGLLLSLSRGAWIAFVVGLAIAAVAGRGPVRRLFSPLVAGAVALLVVGGFALLLGPSQKLAGTSSATAVTIQAQASQALNFASSTGAHRLTAWRTAVREVQSSFLLGLGTNSWGQRHFESTRFGPIPAFLGNWFVRTLYDSGILGLALLLFFFGRIAWPGPIVRKSKGEDSAIARALVFASAGLLVAYLATDALLIVWPWILFGLARAARRVSAAEQQNETGSHGRPGQLAPSSAPEST